MAAGAVGGMGKSPAHAIEKPLVQLLVGVTQRLWAGQAHKAISFFLKEL